MDIVHGMMALRKFDDADVLFFYPFQYFLRCIFYLLINNMSHLILTHGQYAESLLMAPSVLVLTEFDCPVHKCVFNLVKAMGRLVHYKSLPLS